LISILNFKN